MNLLGFWRNRRSNRPELEADHQRAREALRLSGMPDSQFEAMQADEYLPRRVFANVVAGIRERSAPHGVQFPSPARAAAVFSLLTVILVGIAWVAPRFGAAYPFGEGPVEPASAAPACQLGGAGCRVSTDQTLHTLVQFESESQR